MKPGQVRTGGATALVTGAGRGLGRQYARQLAALGYNLILVVRSATIDDAASEIASEAPHISVHAIQMDLATPDAADILYQKVSAEGWNVDVLVNNAGTFSFNDIIETDESTIEGIICLHDMTLTKLCRLFGKDMAARGGGHILNMSSFSVWMPLPGIALYSGSKAYVKAFSLGFSKEMQDKKVYVTAICPAGIATDLYGLSKSLQALGIKVGVLLTPEKCARMSLRALWRHKRYAVPDWWNKAFIPLLMHLPTWIERIIRDKTMKYQS